MVKYEQGVAGKWVQPVRKGYKMACCDCGLVHKMNFRVHKEGFKNYIQFQVFRDNRATAAMRRSIERKAGA